MFVFCEYTRHLMINQTFDSFESSSVRNSLRIGIKSKYVFGLFKIIKHMKGLLFADAEVGISQGDWVSAVAAQPFPIARLHTIVLKSQYVPRRVAFWFPKGMMPTHWSK